MKFIISSYVSVLTIFNAFAATSAFPFFNGKDTKLKLKLKTIVSKKDDKVHVLISIFNTVVLKPENSTFKDQLIQLYEYLRRIHRHVHNLFVKVAHRNATNPWIIILFLLACIIGLITYLMIKLSNEKDNSAQIRNIKMRNPLLEALDSENLDNSVASTNIDNDGTASLSSTEISQINWQQQFKEQNETKLLTQQEQQQKELQDELQKQSLEQCRMIIEDLMSHAMRQKYIDQEYFSMQEHFAALSHSLATMSISPSLASPAVTLSPINSRRSSYHPVLPGSYLEKDEYHEMYTKHSITTPIASATATAAVGIMKTPQVLLTLPHLSTHTRSRSNSVTIIEDNNQYHHATPHHIITITDHTTPMTSADSPTNLPSNTTSTPHSHMAKTTTSAAAALMSVQSSHDDTYFNLPANLKLRYLKGEGDTDENDHGAWDTGSNNSISTKNDGGGMSNKSVTSRTVVSDKSNNNLINNELAKATASRNTTINQHSSSMPSSQSHSLQLAAEAEAALQHQRELQQKLQAERDKLERETILLESTMNEYKREVDKYQIENVTLSTRCASLEQALQKATDRHTTAVKELQKKLIQAESMKNASEEDLLAMQHVIGIAQEEIVSANKSIDSLIEQLNAESLFAMESVAKSEERQLQLQQHYKSIIDDLQQQITHTNISNSNSNPPPRNEEFHVVKSQLDQQVNVNNEMNQELKKYMDKCQELHTKYSHVMSVHEAVREENHLTKMRLVMAEEEIQQLKTLSSPLSARNGSSSNRGQRQKALTSSISSSSPSSAAESISMVEKLSSELKHLEAISNTNASSSSQHTIQPQQYQLASSSSSSASSSSSSSSSASSSSNNNNNNNGYITLSSSSSTPANSSALPAQQQPYSNPRGIHSQLSVVTGNDDSPSQLQKQSTKVITNSNVTPRSNVSANSVSNSTASKAVPPSSTWSPRSTATTISSRDDATTSDKSSSGSKKITSPHQSQSQQVVQSSSKPSSSSSSSSPLPLLAPPSSSAVVTPPNQKNSKGNSSNNSSNNNSNTINAAKSSLPSSNNATNSSNSDNNKIYIITNNSNSNSIKPNTKHPSSSQQSQQPSPLPPSRLSNMLRMAHSSDSDELWGKSAPRDLKPPGGKQNSSHHSLSSNVSVSSGMSGSGVGGGGSSIGSLSPTKSSSNMFNRLLQRPQPPY